MQHSVLLLLFCLLRAVHGGYSTLNLLRTPQRWHRRHKISSRSISRICSGNCSIFEEAVPVCVTYLLALPCECIFGISYSKSARLISHLPCCLFFVCFVFPFTFCFHRAVCLCIPWHSNIQLFRISIYLLFSQSCWCLHTLAWQYSVLSIDWSCLSSFGV